MKLLDYEWVHADPYPERSVQQTMARLRITADGHVLTRFRDRHTGEIHSAIVTPLVRIAEWAVFHWWRLWYEPPVVSGDQHPGYDRAHDLRHAGNGFVLPRILLTPFGSTIRLEATPWETRYADVDFVGGGRASFGLADLKAEFASLIDDVILRLREKGAPEESLERDWEDHPESEPGTGGVLPGGGDGRTRSARRIRGTGGRHRTALERNAGESARRRPVRRRRLPRQTWWAAGFRASWSGWRESKAVRVGGTFTRRAVARGPRKTFRGNKGIPPPKPRWTNST